MLSRHADDRRLDRCLHDAQWYESPTPPGLIPGINIPNYPGDAGGSNVVVDGPHPHLLAPRPIYPQQPVWAIASGPGSGQQQGAYGYSSSSLRSWNIVSSPESYLTGSEGSFTDAGASSSGYSSLSLGGRASSSRSGSHSRSQHPA